MENTGKSLLISDKEVIRKVLVLRGIKVIIDRDISDLYGVTTKRLNEQVKRNKKRFPGDFMFQVTQEEKEEVVAKCDHLKNLKYSSNLPFAFTEHGVVMLASVLNSERAMDVNVQIIRIFIKMREVISTHKDILLQLEKLERKVAVHDDDIKLVFEYLKQLIAPPLEPRPRIGFKRNKEE